MPELRFARRFLGDPGRMSRATIEKAWTDRTLVSVAVSSACVRRWWGPLLAALCGLSACSTCPPGSYEAGAKPPEGQKFWCTKPNEEGTFVPHGPMIVWWETGHKKSEEHYVEGKRHGLARTWHENGKLFVEEMWVAGERHGKYAKYYEDGRPWVVGQYELGEKTGLWVEYAVTGEKKSECHYRRGKKHGKCVTYSDSGAPYEETTWVDGKKKGPWVRWRPNGEVEAKGVH
ncbi:MAG: toxin-antitoxin system YwqK family antitoxin [Deltaproteobacteria bacterium]|nr:MAG: toxin-antitoxin system YwqK family antitoxin [Deltaproteobacteria bacterium]